MSENSSMLQSCFIAGIEVVILIESDADTGFSCLFCKAL